MTEPSEPGRSTDRGPRPLKLRAHDAEDLRALAVCLQDALVPLADVAFLKAERRFVLVANRFRWEAAPGTVDDLAKGPAEEPAPAGDARFEDEGAAAPGEFYERVNCGVCFDRVKSVRVRGLNPRETDQILSLLTIAAGPGHVSLVFSGGAEIRLEVSQIRCHMEDLGQPWPTRWRPSHALDDAEAPDGG